MMLSVGVPPDTEPVKSNTSEPMRTLREQFRGMYRPSEDEWRAAYDDGHVVLDTNALLDAYRLSPSARNDLFNVLEVLRTRLFVPYQVASEFHWRRVDAVSDRVREFEGARVSLSEQHNRIKGTLRNLLERSLGGEESSSNIFEEFVEAFAKADQLIERIRGEYDLDPDIISTGVDDPVLARLEAILDGRVASRPSDEVLRADHQEAERRANEQIPPGYKDKGKSDNSHGDYLWWAEVVRLARLAPKPVLLVCNDVSKGDWTLDRRGIRIGAHPLLVEELWSAAGQSLVLCTTSQLLANAAKYLEVSVSERTVEETRALPVRRTTSRNQNLGTLEDEFFQFPLDIGFRGPVACNATGVSYRQLDYWARTGHIEPEIQGVGNRRLYSLRDLLLLRVTKRLLDAGISLNQVRRAVEHLRIRGLHDLTEVTLMSDGESVYEATSDNEAIDLLSSGEGIFGISLGGVWRDLESILSDLPAERAPGSDVDDS